MKKILYLIPLVLIGFWFTSFAFYKDNVDLLLSKDPNAQITDFADVGKLSPSHWKTLDYNVSFNGSLPSQQTNTQQSTFDVDAFMSGDDSVIPQENTTQTTAPAPEAVYKNAKFKGFPFGAYFSKNSQTSNENSSSSVKISGYSWLWATVDVILVLGTLLLAILVNRKKPKTSAMQNLQSNAQAQPTMNQPLPSLESQQVSNQNNVVTPTNFQQPSQNPTPYQAQPTNTPGYQQPNEQPGQSNPQNPTT